MKNWKEKTMRLLNIRTLGTLFTLLVLSLAAWAGPRVAIVRVLSGDAKLAGTAVQGPQMAEEGQVLVVNRGGEVRIQVLGSNKEMTLKGPITLTLSKVDLLKSAKSLPRDKVAVAAEIGNLQRGAAATSRTTSTLGFAVHTPTVADSGELISRVTTSGVLALTPLDPLEINVYRVLNGDRTLVFSRSYDSEVPGQLEFEKDSLSAGARYMMIVANSNYSYRRYFRILHPDEKDALSESAKILREERDQVDPLASLIHLAYLYQEFDQSEKVAMVIQEILEDPRFLDLDVEMRNDLTIHLNKVRQSLDLPRYSEETKKELLQSP